MKHERAREILEDVWQDGAKFRRWYLGNKEEAINTALHAITEYFVGRLPNIEIDENYDSRFREGCRAYHDKAVEAIQGVEKKEAEDG